MDLPYDLVLTSVGRYILDVLFVLATGEIMYHQVTGPRYWFVLLIGLILFGMSEIGVEHILRRKGIRPLKECRALKQDYQNRTLPPLTAEAVHDALVYGNRHHLSERAPLRLIGRYVWMAEKDNAQ